MTVQYCGERSVECETSEINVCVRTAWSEQQRLARIIESVARAVVRRGDAENEFEQRFVIYVRGCTKPSRHTEGSTSHLGQSCNFESSKAF